MIIEKYLAFIEEDIFPNGILALRECKNAEELILWKKLICKQIHSKEVAVTGDALINLIDDTWESEEVKDQLSMP